MRRSADVAYGEATLRTHPSSGQATVDSALIAKSPCLPLRGSVDVAKPSVQGLLVDSLGFWVQWGKEVSHVSPH